MAMNARAQAPRVPDRAAPEGLEAKWGEAWEDQGTYAFDRTATREQVMDGEGFDRIARQLAKRLNVRIRSERGWNLDARQQLFRSLVTMKDVEASWTKTRRFFICK